jgi:ABC-type transporter Mla subunit MlaD
LVAALTAAALALSAAGGEGDSRRYTIELDNAFGLVEGGDVRVAGVNAGSVEAIELDTRTKKALVEVALTETGFGSLRSDVFCESRPQSPIGEYYVDCLPGTDAKEIPLGARVPVEQTASTIPPDLIQNVMRLPYRERFRLIVNEFGAGLAGRPEDLNETIRRAVPALRQTSRLLEVLAEHDRVIRDLVADADTVVTRLADNRRDVGRFVEEARDTSAASAQRAGDIRQNFNRLPHFLEELTPTMVALGEVAEEQRPVLADLGESAAELRRFFDDTAGFATASRPAIRAFGEAAEVGRPALTAARPRIRELRGYSRPTPDLARNLRIVLEDFDDPGRAVEPDPRSPGGAGYSGTQAVLRYVFGQSLTINAFDELGYMVRSASHASQCGSYADAAEAREPDKENCRSWLGPNQPGVNAPDPSPAAPPTTATVRKRGRGRRHAGARRPARGRSPAAPAPAPGGPGASPGAGGPALPDIVSGLLESLGVEPPLQGDGLRLPGAGRRPSADPAPLLDFLLAP